MTVCKGEMYFRQLKSHKLPAGYRIVKISGRDEYLHRIVGTCFTVNPHGYPEINHMDGDKDNNRAENLEWCTRSQNNKHAYLSGLQYRYHRRTRVLTTIQAGQIKELLRAGNSIYSIAQKFNCKSGTVCGIKAGKTYKEA